MFRKSACRPVEFARPAYRFTRARSPVTMMSAWLATAHSTMRLSGSWSRTASFRRGATSSAKSDRKTAVLESSSGPRENLCASTSSTSWMISLDMQIGYAEVQLAVYDQVDSQTRAGPPPSRATCARGPTLYMSIASATSTDPPAASNGQPFALATASSWSFASIRL